LDRGSLSPHGAAERIRTSTGWLLEPPTLPLVYGGMIWITVYVSGFAPLTPCSQGKCSPAELHVVETPLGPEPRVQLLNYTQSFDRCHREDSNLRQRSSQNRVPSMERWPVSRRVAARGGPPGKVAADGVEPSPGARRAAWPRRRPSRAAWESVAGPAGFEPAPIRLTNG